MPFVYVILNGLPDFQDFLFIIAATNFDTQAILSLNAINKNERLNCWLKNFTKEYIMQNIFFFAFLNFHVLVLSYGGRGFWVALMLHFIANDKGDRRLWKEKNIALHLLLAAS